MNKTSSKKAETVKNKVKSAFFTVSRGERDDVLQDKLTDSLQDNMNDSLQDNMNDSLQDNMNDRRQDIDGSKVTSLTRPDRKDIRITFRLRRTTIERLKRAAADSKISLNEAAGQIFDAYLTGT